MSLARSTRQPAGQRCTQPPAARATPRISQHGRQAAHQPAGAVVLDTLDAKQQRRRQQRQQPSATPASVVVPARAPADGLYVQPQADVSSAQRNVEAASPSTAATLAAGAAALARPGHQWERLYSGTGPSGLAPRPHRLLTAAPGTAAAKHSADPRLVHLTQELMQCGGEAQMRGVLQREHDQGLGAADVRRLLTYLNRQGAADVALTAFHAMKAAGLPWAGDAVLRTKLIKMHSRRPKDTAAALALYDEMRRDGIPPDAVTYNTCLTAAGLGCHWGRVLGLLGDMKAAGVPRDAFTYSALLSACQACGEWQQALEWFQQAQTTPGLQLNVVHYTTLMSCLQKAGQWEQSLSVFRQMEAAGVVPDVVAHNAAIAACAKGGDWEAGWAVFLAMRQAGLQPSTISYNALLSACERCGQPDRALEVFEGMQRRGRPPNAVTFNTLISACAKAGLYAKAQELHAAMGAAGIPEDVFTLTALITACERIGHWQGAEDHFLGFQARGVMPNTVAYNRLISALGRSGEWERALAAFRAMHGGSAGTSSASSSDRSSASGSSVAFGGNGGDIRAASSSTPAGSGTSDASSSTWPAPSSEVWAIYASSAPAKPDRITYGSLIAALERGGQWERALALFEEMQAAGIQPNGYIFTSLINACEKGGQWEMAVRLFKLMQGQDIPQDSMAMVARKALYAFPPLIKLMPAPLLQAARATVDSGRAARQWIEDSKKQREEDI